MLSQAPNALSHLNSPYPTAHPGQKTRLVVSSKQNSIEASGIETWRDQNESLYQSILAGQSGLSPSDESLFLEWWNWSNQQVQTDELSVDGLLGEASGSTLPEGAILGPAGNIVFNSESAEANYAPNTRPIDVLSDAFTLNVNVKVQDITVDRTTDTRLTPPSEVIRIVVKDPYSVPNETVYLVQANAQITLNTVGGKGVNVQGEIENLTVGTFASPSELSAAQANLQGEPVAGEMDAFYYEVASADQSIEFHPAAGKDETHYLVGNATITLPVSSKADVQPSDKPDYDAQIVVTHKDGSTDIFYVKKPFKTLLNAVEGYVGFNGDFSDDSTVPGEFSGLISLSGGETGGMANTNDSQPDDLITGRLPGDHQLQDAKHPAQKAIYNRSETVSLTADPSDSIRYHEIYARDVTLSVANFQDEVTVSRQAEGYLVTVSGPGGKEYFWVDENVNSLTINGNKIHADGMASDAKLKIGENDAVEGTPASDLLENFLGIAGGKNEAQWLSALNSNGFHFTDAAALKAAIDDGSFPPAYGSADFQHLIKAMYAFDPVFSGAVNSATEYSGASLNLNYKNAAQRLVQLLGALYPDHNVSVSSPNASDSDWKRANDVSFDGVTFSITKEAKGHTSELAF